MSPNQPKTPHKSIRVDPELWEAAKREAEWRGETISDAIREFLRRYSAGDERHEG